MLISEELMKCRIDDAAGKNRNALKPRTPAKTHERAGPHLSLSHHHIVHPHARQRGWHPKYHTKNRSGCKTQEQEEAIEYTLYSLCNLSHMIVANKAARGLNNSSREHALTEAGHQNCGGALRSSHPSPSLTSRKRRHSSSWPSPAIAANHPWKKSRPYYLLSPASIILQPARQFPPSTLSTMCDKCPCMPPSPRLLQQHLTTVSSIIHSHAFPARSARASAFSVAVSTLNSTTCFMQAPTSIKLHFSKTKLELKPEIICDTTSQPFRPGTESPARPHLRVQVDPSTSALRKPRTRLQVGITASTSPIIIAKLILYKNMATINYGTDYKRFSRSRCFKFIRQRGGTIPSGKKAKNVNPRNILRQMDLEARFPFMDLPPEMRNEIYTVLLSRNPNEGRKAFPEILRVSKQIYKEALGILRAESFFSMILETQKTLEEACRIYVRDFESIAEIIISPNNHLDLYHYSNGLGILRKIEKIQLDAGFCLGTARENDWASFAYFVDIITTHAVNLKTLDVTADDQRGPLKVFSKLPETVTLDIRGFDDDEVFHVNVSMIFAGRDSAKARYIGARTEVERLQSSWQQGSGVCLCMGINVIIAQVVHTYSSAAKITFLEKRFRFQIFDFLAVGCRKLRTLPPRRCRTRPNIEGTARELE
ncbi:uncharacterized protein MYCFIDRAFT_171594 [Pseudocercospora fijiensis CIRAD86]|uniref:Uncharacterized protein n=1 Tax=Pseudocercospora fijiensis (strain CIRAD86) TaxID=383855 RepID=M3B8T7_PSEFD|nr:uncharacterized protein MYCFIDRAFT_171594 [Pseudocercospora fijiensis CIRAD86]EME85713.1 hypothetical protein MYCFIDRAFT_171594 [Pseudocercospora fijiensis CIRAD86]